MNIHTSRWRKKECRENWSSSSKVACSKGKGENSGARERERRFSFKSLPRRRYLRKQHDDSKGTGSRQNIEISLIYNFLLYFQMPPNLKLNWIKRFYRAQQNNKFGHEVQDCKHWSRLQLVKWDFVIAVQKSDLPWLFCLAKLYFLPFVTFGDLCCHFSTIVQSYSKFLTMLKKTLYFSVLYLQDRLSYAQTTRSLVQPKIP